MEKELSYSYDLLWDFKKKNLFISINKNAKFIVPPNLVITRIQSGEGYTLYFVDIKKNSAKSIFEFIKSIDFDEKINIDQLLHISWFIRRISPLLTKFMQKKLKPGSHTLLTKVLNDAYKKIYTKKSLVKGDYTFNIHSEGYFWIYLTEMGSVDASRDNPEDFTRSNIKNMDFQWWDYSEHNADYDGQSLAILCGIAALCTLYREQNK